MRLLTLAMVVAVALAGCSDAPVAVDDTPPAKTTSTTGAIAGIVVDGSISPIVGSSVRIDALGLETTVDEDGAFVFEDLEPGVYFINADATDHISAQTSATVVAGEVSKARLQLVYSPVPVPVPVTEKFEGRIELADAWVVWILGEFTGNTELCKCWFYPSVEEGAQTAIFEMFWTPSSPANDPGMWIDHYTPDGDYDGNNVDNPARLQFDASSWSAGEVTIQVSVGTTVQIQQDFEIFYTVWYGGPAPDGWTIQP